MAEDETPGGDEPDAAAAAATETASAETDEAERQAAVPLADTTSAEAAEEAAVPLADTSSAEAAEEAAVPLAETTSAEEEDAFPVESLMEALRQAKVSELLISTVSTLASVAYGKLEAADLAEARLAIDAIGALLPLLAGRLAEPILRDLEQALANLRLAYADAVSGAQ